MTALALWSGKLRELGLARRYVAVGGDEAPEKSDT